MENTPQKREKIFDRSISKSALLNMLEDLYNAKEELNRIFEAAGDGMCVIDRNFNILRVNRMFAILLGIGRNEAVGKKCYEVFGGPQCHTPLCLMDRILGGEERIENEVERNRKDGIRIAYIVTATPLQGADGELIGVVENFKDITERNKAMESIEEAKRYTANIIKSMADTLIVTDAEGNIKSVNRETLDLLGYKREELIGKPAGILFAEEEEEEELFKGERLERLLKEGSVRDYAMTYRTKNGEKISISFSGSVMKSKEGEVVGIVGVARDMRELLKLHQREKKLTAAAAAETARIEALEEAKSELEKKVEERTAELREAYANLKDTQEQLLQSGKLAAVGELAAGVAHELNNPLAGVLGVSDILLKEVPADSVWRKDLEIIKQAALRCKTIISSLLGFSRSQEFRIQTTAIGEVINKTLDICQNQINVSRLQVVKKYAENLPPVEMSISQIQQAFLNLILNSLDAMPDGGVLTISTDSVDDSKIQVVFSDTGKGIAKETLPQIFDPFFTTKETGKGTGLGLSLCHSIIERHGGRIQAKSEGPDKGAEFIITLSTKIGGTA